MTGARAGASPRWAPGELAAKIAAVTGGRRPAVAWREFFAPESWDDLSGPSEGELALPMHLDWTPGPNVYDVSDVVRLRQAYRIVLHEGNVDEICRLVNPRLLAGLWGTGFELTVGDDVRSLWESRFPAELGVA